MIDGVLGLDKRKFQKLTFTPFNHLQLHIIINISHRRTVQIHLLWLICAHGKKTSLSQFSGVKQSKLKF